MGGEAAYEAFRKFLTEKMLRGLDIIAKVETLAEWRELPIVVQEAWDAAADAAVEEAFGESDNRP